MVVGVPNVFSCRICALVGIAAEECGLNQAVDMGTYVYEMFPLDYRMEVLPSLFAYALIWHCCQSQNITSHPLE
jgi:hypothetical protein